MGLQVTEKIQELFTQGRHLKYKKGEVFLHPGDEPQGIYYLTKGYVNLYSVSEDGRELTLIIFKPQDVFPYIWALNDVSNQYYLETVTPCELWCVPKKDFLNFIKENNDVFFEITRKILIRLGGILKRMEYLVFGSAYNKVASIILICAKRFGQKSPRGILISVPLTHKNIANLVGTTRETTSIEIKKLEKKGLIVYQGRFLVVRNEPLLRREAVLE